MGSVSKTQLVHFWLPRHFYEVERLHVTQMHRAHRSRVLARGRRCTATAQGMEVHPYIQKTMIQERDNENRNPSHLSAR